MNKILKTLLGICFLLMSNTFVYAENQNINFYNKILFVEKGKIGKTYLSVMDADGKNVKRLTDAMFSIAFPRYNDKTGLIGFTNFTENMEAEIYLLDAKNKVLTKILNGSVLQDFSPDGKSLLYTSTGDNPSLYIYDVNKKEKVKISKSLKVASANWSRVGDWIVSSVYNENGILDLYYITPYSGELIRLTNTVKSNEAFPMFSPDALKFVYFTNRNGKYNELEIMGASSNAETIGVFKTGLKGTNPCFSPDGQFILYQDGNDIMVAKISDKTHLLKDIKLFGSQKIGTGNYPYWVK